MAKKIKTLHPDPKKKGVSIDKDKYDVIKETILETLEREGEMTFKNLFHTVEKKLLHTFEGSIGWYYTTVKLDLEARDILERLPDKKQQHLRIKKDK